jgi:hypothetical protein
MHPKGHIDRAISEAVAAALEPSQRHRKRADSASRSLDHLLSRPVPGAGRLVLEGKLLVSIAEMLEGREQAHLDLADDPFGESGATIAGI